MLNNMLICHMVYHKYIKFIKIICFMIVTKVLKKKINKKFKVSLIFYLKLTNAHTSCVRY